MTDLRVRRARRMAAALLARWGVEREKPVPVEELARARGLRVTDGPLDGALARLVRVGDGGSIRLSDRHAHAGQRRFSLAHELGHFELAHDHKIDLCEAADLASTDKLRELEANAFAAELLLPEAALRRRCEVSPVTLDHVIALAEEYGTSPVATAIRFVELTSERAAAVLSQNGRVRWAARSATFWPNIARGQRVLPWSVAHSFFVQGKLACDADMVDATAWIDGTRLHGPAEIREHALALPQLRAVLSLLWIPEACAQLAARVG
jgi:hypothetical protein